MSRISLQEVEYKKEGCRCFKADDPYSFYFWIPKVLLEQDENLIAILEEQIDDFFKEKRINIGNITAIFMPLSESGKYNEINICYDGKKKPYNDFKWKYS